MLKLASVLVASSLLAATAGCSSPADSLDNCPSGRSSLSSIDPATGEVAWHAALSQASEVAPKIEDGSVVVMAPCGVAVVDLVDGQVRYEADTPGRVVGVLGDQLLTLDNSRDDGTDIVGLSLDTGKKVAIYSVNTPFQDATVADGSLITLYGEILTATSGIGARPWWSIQLPVHGRPQVARSGQLVLVVADDGSTWAVDLADGTLVWRTVPPLAARRYALQVTSVPGTVLTAASTNEETRRSLVYATDARAGGLRWTRPALSVLGADEDITVLRTVLAVVAVDTTTGAMRWRRRASSLGVHADVATAALTRDTVVVPRSGAAALGLDRKTGRVRWQGPESSTALADGEILLLRTPDGVTALDASTGAKRWSRTSERPQVELAVAPNGQLLLLDTDVVAHPVEGQ